MNLSAEPPKISMTFQARFRAALAIEPSLERMSRPSWLRSGPRSLAAPCASRRPARSDRFRRDRQIAHAAEEIDLPLGMSRAGSCPGRFFYRPACRPAQAEGRQFRMNILRLLLDPHADPHDNRLNPPLYKALPQRGESCRRIRLEAPVEARFGGFPPNIKKFLDMNI